MKKVYTASGWKFRKDTAKINEALRQHNLNVISTWIEEETGLSTPEDFRQDAARDIKQVSEADVLLAIMNDKEYAYRGTYTEMGAAMALSKPICVVCPGFGQEKKLSEKQYDYPYYCMRNVFFWHPLIHHVTTLDEAVAYIKGL